MPWPLNGGGSVFAFGRSDLVERGDRDAGLFGEGLRRRARLPVGKGRFPGRAGKLFLHVELLGKNAFDAHRKPAWGGVAGNDSSSVQ